jgi:glycosyltransferase involved in cell wall biosynthesis
MIAVSLYLGKYLNDHSPQRSARSALYSWGSKSVRPLMERICFQSRKVSIALTAADRSEGGRRLSGGMRDVRPLVSIVVVVFRDREELHEVAQSVFPHQSRDVELIVIDGGSDDGTVELLSSLNGQIDYWMSEPDEGIYDAMNKGVAASRGEYILHLNAGDRLIQVPLDTLRRCLEDDIDVASCGVLIDRKNVYVPKTGFPMKIANWWHHQGTFYRRSSHLGYDTGYRICGDFELNQRLVKAGASVRLFADIVAEHQNNGISMHPSGQKEIFRSIRLHFGAFYLPIAFLRLELSKLKWAIVRRLRAS